MVLFIAVSHPARNIMYAVMWHAGYRIVFGLEFFVGGGGDSNTLLRGRRGAQALRWGVISETLNHPGSIGNGRVDGGGDLLAS